MSFVGPPFRPDTHAPGFLYGLWVCGDLSIVAFHTLRTKRAHIRKVSHSFDVNYSASERRLYAPPPKIEAPVVAETEVGMKLYLAHLVEASESIIHPQRRRRCDDSPKSHQIGAPPPSPRWLPTPPTGVNVPPLNTFCVVLIPLCCCRLSTALCFAEALDSH